MEQDRDILFSDLGIGEVRPCEELEKSYANYADEFNHIACGLERVILSSERKYAEEPDVEEKIESDIERVLRGDKDRQFPVRELRDDYHRFVREFYNFLELNPSIREKLVNLGFDIVGSEFWPERFDDIWFYTPWYVSETALSVQFAGCTYLVVDRLWDVYQFLTKRNTDVYELTYDGCKLIGYSWRDYFRTLRYIPKMPFLIIKAIMSFTIGIPMLGKKTIKRFNAIEQVGAAFADYPYKYDHSGTIYIQPLPLRSRSVVARIMKQYKKSKRKLDLDDRYGLSVALFDCHYNGTAMRCVSYAGTRLGVVTARKRKVMVQNIVTDIFQYLDVPSKTYFEAVGILNDVMKSFPNRNIYVFGHSLGGGLMQYACTVLNNSRLHGYGYNSAGLSDNTVKTIPGYKKQVLKSQIEHLCSLHDPVSRLGNTISEVKYVDSVRGWKAHCLKQLNMKLNGGKELKVSYR